MWCKKERILEGGDRFPRRNFLRFNCFKLFLKKDLKILNIVNEKPIFLVLKIFKYDNGFGTEIVFDIK